MDKVSVFYRRTCVFVFIWRQAVLPTTRVPAYCHQVSQAIKMSIDLYYMRGSPSCNAVRMLARTLGLEMNMKLLNYDQNEHKTTEFKKMNPQQTAPTINDNGFTVYESRAILGYLADQYGKDDSLYPKDPKLQAVVNQRLYFDIGTLCQHFIDYYYPVFYEGKFGNPSKLTKLEEAFQVLDKYLERENWIAGKNLTIADYSILSSVAAIECCGFDVRRYPNVHKWYTNAQKTLPGYDDIIGEGSILMKELFDKSKK